MKKIMVLSLLALAAASWTVDQRVDVMGYDIAQPEPSRTVSKLELLNDVNARVSRVSSSSTSATSMTISSTPTTTGTWASYVCGVSQPAGVVGTTTTLAGR